MRISSALAGATLVAAALAVCPAGRAVAQTPGAPPSWDTLTRCAAMGDSDARLSCYDTAMREAGYAPKPEVVAAEKRKRFGLRAPKLDLFRHDAKEEGAQASAGPAATAVAEAGPSRAAASGASAEGEDQVAVELTRVDTLYNGKYLLFTADGALWEQTATMRVQPAPKAGQTIVIRHTRLGGYFCDLNKWKAVRCERSR